jgi:FAD/FMN-containing dehydrogenase
MVPVTTLTGSVELSDDTVRAFGRSLEGPLLLPGRAGYDDARTIWNRMIDRRPALIARCADANDVVRAVEFAREHDLLVSVRGGGHNVTGHAVCDAGLMIDLSAMKASRVDPERRVIAAEPGLTWKDFDTATQAFGLATTGGIVSTTGVPGLTLGGGHGWLMRRFGLACDNLVSAQVVTADARLVSASTDENPDLFWGLRGGGGNFGVVTSFEFRLHPITTVLAGYLLYPLTRAKDVLDAYRELAASAPDEVTLGALITVWSDGTPVIDRSVYTSSNSSSSTSAPNHARLNTSREG